MYNYRTTMKKKRKHPIKMITRLAYLFFLGSNNCDELVQKSYDRISTGYDQIWTSHMRDLTASLINRVSIKEGYRAIDLACGTGFATNLIAKNQPQRLFSQKE